MKNALCRKLSVHFGSAYGAMPRVMMCTTSVPNTSFACRTSASTSRWGSAAPEPTKIRSPLWTKAIASSGVRTLPW